MKRRLPALILLLAVMLVAACADSPGRAPAVSPTPNTPGAGDAVRCSPQIAASPCGHGAVAGQAYRYQLYTHCGVLWAYFDGRWWRASPALDDGSGNPPRGWGNPFDDGRMMLVSPDHARFTSAAGLVAAFDPLPHDVQEYPGQGCD